MRSRRGSHVLVTLGLLMVFGAGEMGARVLEPRLSSAGTWPSGDIAAQYDVVSSIQREGRKIDVIFAGSSMIRRAVDAEQFEGATGLTAVNAALPASSNFMIKPWLLDVVIPLLDPKIVVIGVASRDFNDNATRSQSYDALVSSPGYRQIRSDGVMARADRGLSDVSALFRVRRSLRSPEHVIAAIRGEPDRSFLRACQRQEKGKRAYRRGALRRGDRRRYLQNYETGGTQTDVLVETIERVRSDGRTPLLLALPHTDDYLDLHDDPSDYAKFERALRIVRKRTGVAMFDGRQTSSRSLFRDPLHLNCRGTAAFTAVLVRAWGSHTPEGRVELPDAADHEG